MADRVSQAAVEVVRGGSPKAIVSQQAVEVVRGGNPKALISQVAVEVIRAHPVTVAGVSQIAVEVIREYQHLQVLPSISSTTAVYAPVLVGNIAVPFIGSTTAVHAPTLVGPSNEIDLPFIASRTRVFGVFSLFTDTEGTGPGNGGETFGLRLNANGATETATLDATITTTSGALRLTGDGGMPTSVPFILRIDGEEMLVFSVGGGDYRIRRRALGNTAAAGHTAGASATWTDSYDQAIVATQDIDHDFTADITGTGATTYPGWLMCFDATQAYLGGSRYPMHVTEVVGVFDAGAGVGGANRCDAAQPNSIASTAAVSDDCPAALSNPARLAAGILTGDVAVVRYTNPEATVLDLGPRSTALQSWFGLKRVDATDHDVTFTDPTGHVIDGSVEGEWHNPLGPGIAPDTGLPTPHDVPYTSVTLPGTSRTYTHGPPGYGETGWPIGVLTVRQGTRRVPFWQSWDWHNFSFVYSGFGTDDTFAQIVINRNGIVFGSVPEVALPGPQDIDGPDAVWDDGSYYFGVAWYVAIFAGPYLIAGPSVGGTSGTPGDSGFVPTVSFPAGGGGGSVSLPPFVEGGSGGDIPPPGGDLHVWQYFS